MKKQTPTINLDYLLDFTKGDQAKMHRYITMYLKTAPKVINELQIHLESSNLENLKLQAHSIKPQVQYMGVSELKKTLIQLEEAVKKNKDKSYIQSLINKAREISSKATEELEEYLSN